MFVVGQLPAEGGVLRDVQERTRHAPHGEATHPDTVARLPARRHAGQRGAREGLGTVGVGGEHGDLVAVPAHQFLGEALDDPLGAAHGRRVALDDVEDAQRPVAPRRRRRPFLLRGREPIGSRGQGSSSGIHDPVGPGRIAPVARTAGAPLARKITAGRDCQGLHGAQRRADVRSTGREVDSAASPMAPWSPTSRRSPG